MVISLNSILSSIVFLIPDLVFYFFFLSIKSKYINKEAQEQRFQIIHRKYTKRNPKGK